MYTLTSQSRQADAGYTWSRLDTIYSMDRYFLSHRTTDPIQPHLPHPHAPLMDTSRQLLHIPRGVPQLTIEHTLRRCPRPTCYNNSMTLIGCRPSSPINSPTSFLGRTGCVVPGACHAKISGRLSSIWIPFVRGSRLPTLP